MADQISSGTRTRQSFAGSVHAFQLLFVAHCVGFAVLLALPEGSVQDALDAFGVSDLGSIARRPWTIATHVFLHRTPLEFLVATGLLLAVGGEVERALGAARFLVLYLLSGAAVAVAHAVLPAGFETLGPSFTGGLGATAALLTAYLFIFHERRTLGVVPAQGFYVMAALVVLATIVFVDLEHASIARRRVDELVLQAARPAEFIDTIFRLDAHRADAFAHLLGFAAGAAALFADLAVARARERVRTRREIAGLEEEVVARAKVEQLLEKISREGIASLSSRERKFLKYASQRFYRNDLLRSS